MRKKIKAGFVLFCLWMCCASQVVAQWEQTLGPVGGGVACIYPDHDGVWAGSGTGLVFSPDDGLHWIIRNQGLPQFVESFLRNGTTLFAGTSSNGVYISVDEGTSWEWTSLNNSGVYSILKLGGSIFAGTGKGVYRSTNNGANWLPVNAGLSNTPILALVTNGTDLFAGCWDGVFKSTDNGNSWTEANNGLPAAKIIVSLAYAGNHLYAVTGSSGVFTSTDNAGNWISINNGLPGLYSSTVAAHNNTVFVVTVGKLYRSTAYGLNWTLLSNDLEVFSSETLAIRGDSIYDGDGSHGLYRSSDNGDSWSPIGFVESYVQCLASRGGHIIAGLFDNTNNGGVCYSDSTGVNWRTSNYNHSSAYDFDSIGSLTYAAIGGVMVSADYGKTWTATNPLYAGSLVQSIAINGNYLFAGTQDDGVFLSLDGGNSWNPSNTGMSNERVYDILIDGQDMYATGYFGVYLSTDHGNTWQDRSTGIADISVRSLTNIGGKIYAGTYRGVFVTQDKGLTWIPSGLDTIPVNLILNFQGSILAATAQGVYVSGDDGATWDSSSTGLSNRDVRSLVIFNDKIFAGTFGAGVWQTSASSLLGVSGTCRQDLFSVSPNPADQKILIEWGDCRYENVNARLFNCSGVCVWSGQYRGMHSGELDVSNIPGGIYILKLMTGRQSTDLKIVVVHDDK